MKTAARCFYGNLRPWHPGGCGFRARSIPLHVRRNPELYRGAVKREGDPPLRLTDDTRSGIRRDSLSARGRGGRARPVSTGGFRPRVSSRSDLGHQAHPLFRWLSSGRVCVVPHGNRAKTHGVACPGLKMSCRSDWFAPNRSALKLSRFRNRAKSFSLVLWRVFFERTGCLFARKRSSDA